MSLVVRQGWQDLRSRKARTPERRLLLLLAASSRARTSDRVARLAAVADERRLLGLMAQHRVMGTLGPRLLELAPTALSDASRAVIRDHTAHVRRRSALQDMALEHVLRELRKRGMAVVVLKGPRFAEAVYGDAGARLSGDLDILVETERLDDAQTTLAELGWSDRGDLRGEDGLPLLHLGNLHEHHLPTVEVHWRVHWYETAFAQQALRRSVEQGSDRLEPDDELLSLLLYIARDGLSGLRLVVDAISWLDKHGDGSVAALPRLLSAHPELAAPAYAALRMVASVEGLGRPAPEATTTRQRAADALADPLLLMSAKQTRAERALMDILLAPDPAEAVSRQLVPRTGVLRAWADDRLAPPTAAEVAAHTARSLRRFGLAGALRTTTATRPTSRVSRPGPP